MNEAAGLRWAEDGSDAAVADHIEGIVASADEAIIAVPGGSTPKTVFAELAQRNIDWTHVTLMPGDDRMVPRDHPASNLSPLEAAFGQHGAHIRALEEGMSVPELDLNWLGMGNDGHVASLFPQMEIFERPGPAVIRTIPDPLPPEAPHPRLSLNMEALTQAACETILVLRGAEKRRVLDAALEQGCDLPVARFLRRARGPVTVYWSAQ